MVFRRNYIDARRREYDDFAKRLGINVSAENGNTFNDLWWNPNSEFKLTGYGTNVNQNQPYFGGSMGGLDLSLPEIDQSLSSSRFGNRLYTESDASALGSTASRYNVNLPALSNHFDTQSGGGSQGGGGFNWLQTGIGALGTGAGLLGTSLLANTGKEVARAAAKRAIGSTVAQGAGAATKFGSALGASSLSSAAGAGIAAGGALIGGLAKHFISDGYSNDVGNAIADIGGPVGGIIGYFNPIIGGIVSAATGLIGGAINRAFSVKTDQAKLAEARQGIAGYRNTNFNVDSLDDLPALTSYRFQNPYESGWFKSASGKNEAIKNEFKTAKDFAERGIENTAQNLEADAVNRELANSAAFGGLLSRMDNNSDMNAIEYGFLSDYLAARDRQNENKNKLPGMTQMPAFMPQQFALGGDIQMNGGDFTTGLSHINAGGSHEMNPNDGVQLGKDRENVPNLVEEGETVFDDYVYSTRILADAETKQRFRLPKKKDISFADISKKLEKEASERPNDPISQAGLKAEMHALAEQQERQKQEMEAARAKAAFDALSPEEQTALMEQRAAQEQALQQETMQQPTPEQLAMAQQQQAMMADGSQPNLGQEPQLNCFGGKVHRFDKGGEMKKKLFSLLGLHTDREYDEWLKANELSDIEDSKDWENILQNKAIMTAIAKDNPALQDAISNGYDFGVYQPENNGKATIQSISKGNWKTTNGKGWRGSDDLAFKQATEGMTDEQIDALTTEQLATLMKGTEAYQNTNKWLQNKDNALQYLNTLYNDPDTPQVAKDYAAKFIKDGQWKDGFNYDYATVFGADGKGVRETNPGTYWHTALEANRGNQIRNLVQDADGNWEEIIGDVPADWTSVGNYSWANPENDLTYNYYQRPAAAVIPEAAKTPEQQVAEDEGNDLTPKKSWEGLRYAGLLGPAIGLGLQAAGVGRPDTASLDAAVKGAGNYREATYQPLGNYLTYRPLDRLFQQNMLNAQSRATDRGIMNSGSNQGAKMAGLLANGYNSQLASGNLFRQEQEYNDALRKQVAEFNRGTDQFNAEQFGATSRFNAGAYNEANRAAAQMKLAAAREKLDADAGWYNSLYGNIGALTKGIADIGVENKRDNMINWMLSKGIFGAVDPNDPFIKSRVKETKKGK